MIDGLRADVALEWPSFASVRTRFEFGSTGTLQTSPVTMTMTGIRSAATGTLADLRNILYNWSGARCPAPSVFTSAREAGIRSGIVGDVGWAKLFEHDMDFTETETGIDRVNYILEAETRPDEIFAENALKVLRTDREQRLMVVHLVGLDHAGHRRGVNSEKYRDTSKRIAVHIGALMDAAQPGTTVLITGDHGSTDAGGHGGASLSETTVPLLAGGPGVRTAHSVRGRLIDLAPTIACLLGLRIPSASLGIPLVATFAEHESAGLHRLSTTMNFLSNRAAATLTDSPISSFEDARRRADAVVSVANGRERSRRYRLAGWAAIFVMLAGLLVLAALHGAPTRAPWPAALGLSLALFGTGADSWLAIAIAGAVVAPTVVQALRRSRPSLPMLLALSVSVGFALWAASSRDGQVRSATLWFGNPSGHAAAIAGLASGLAVGVLFRTGATWTFVLLAAVIAALLTDGGDPAIEASAGLLAGLLPFVLGKTPREKTAWTVVLAAGALYAWGIVVGLLPRLPITWAIMEPRALLPAAGLAAAGIAWVYIIRIATRSNDAPWRTWPARLAFALALATLGCATYNVALSVETAVPAGLALGLMGTLASITASLTGTPRAAAATCAAGSWFGLWSLLCTPDQLYIAGMSTAALTWFLARQATLEPRPAALLLVAMAIVAWRWALIGHFEGGFGFGNLEVTVAYLGNPGRDFHAGVLRVVVKLLSPLCVAVSLAVTIRPKHAPIIVSAVAFVLALRVAHLAFGIAADPTSFYSTYRLTGELVYQLILLGGGVLMGLALLSPRRSNEGGPVDGTDDVRGSVGGGGSQKVTAIRG
ncbi:MAG: hypothetical protein ACI9OJ_001097 [Myxococcota bacterium]|jgi:hypothetical protein